VGVENAEDAYQALNHVKVDDNVNPVLAVSDFSPNMINAICRVWGEGVLQIDGYHVMQELNNGIRVDLARFRELTYSAQIREFYSLRDTVSELQKKDNFTDQYDAMILGQIRSMTAQYSQSQLCGEITRDTILILEAIIPTDCLSAVANFLSKWQESTERPVREMCQMLEALLPKRDLTDAGARRIKTKVLQLLKTLYVAYRKVLEEESITFFHHQWVLFFQPEDLTPDRALLLTEFLTKYPELEEYRQITLQIGSIYRKPIDSIDGSEISSLLVKSTYTDKLQTALRTIQTYQEAILQFVSVFKEDPTLAKACRANMEPYNHRFKAPFNKGLNCTKKDHLI
jgi:hypothetical protein